MATSRGLISQNVHDHIESRIPGALLSYGAVHGERVCGEVLGLTIATFPGIAVPDQRLHFVNMSEN